ncbi:uncharacterized protein C16orf52 homolog isoform X2 [Lingula anatina]|uniref:Uncharacterized protein C16orf52 homolog isoform X1 n=1 Tax=Lingula anatina TaxID=7574 RepID=A0A1S3HE36_LINAN|nr:uncharacterized protein C16orf52 homolog isoform X1 [Lingula anatina]XP_013384338.1 uncharacterized protein C16orf52 homolog isoform X2 [Lingula anatina]|eukprot:XP_013384337.1 uncharacterized protein C16orf52 homolog isoform X1 [Lingula anatina]
MDKLSIISGALFLVADLFAIASLSMPMWLVSDVGGYTSIGLLQTCIEMYYESENDNMRCFTPHPLRFEWVLTFILIVLGILFVSATVVLHAVSYWKEAVIKVARWLGFVGMLLFCNAAIIFPVAFDMAQVGGKAFHLPNNFQVGISYIFFVLALWITVISELFAGKVCLPRF